MRLQENQCTKIPVICVKERHDEQLGFEASSQTLGRLLRHYFGDKFKKQQDSSKQYNYYGLELSPQVNSTVDMADDDNNKIDTPANQKKTSAIKSSDKVTRKALNLYRAERLEKNETVQALSILQSRNKFEKRPYSPQLLVPKYNRVV